jgi:hypothetical protein
LPGFGDLANVRAGERVSESIGVYLARQRELRGISLDQLAASTRIPRHSLERLEAGAFDASPDGFARAFVRTVAVALGLEPDDTVNRMRPEPGGLHGRARGALGGPWLLALVAAALAVLVPFAWLNWLAPPGPAPGPGSAKALEPELVVRPDAVRRLAAEVGALQTPPARGSPSD